MFLSLRSWMHENFVAIMVAFILGTLLNVAVCLNFITELGVNKTKIIKLERIIEENNKQSSTNFKVIDESLSNHKQVIELIIKGLNGRDNDKRD